MSKNTPTNNSRSLTNIDINNKNENAVRNNRKYVDSSWSWLVCLSCFIGNFAIGTVCMSFGVILPSLEKFYGEGSGLISLIGSTEDGLTLIVMPLAAKVADRFGLRMVYMMGSLISVAALVLSTFSPNAYILLVTYGIINGIGFGFVSLVVGVACNHYFDKHRALAVGIGKTGISISSFVFPPISNFVLTKYNWKSVLYVKAIVAVICCLFGSLITPLSLCVDTKDHDDKAVQGYGNKVFDEKLVKMKRSSFWSDRSFVFLTISITLGHVCWMMYFIFIPSMIISKAFSSTDASFVLLSTGITNTVGRIAVGALMDHPKINPTILTATSYIFSGMILAILPFVNNFMTIIAISGCFGIIISPYNVGLAVILGNMVAEKELSSAYANIGFVQGLGTVIGPSIIGYIYDLTKDYRACFLFATCLYLIAAVSCWLSYYVHRRHTEDGTVIRYSRL